MRNRSLNFLTRILVICLVVVFVAAIQPTRAKADAAWTILPIVGAVLLGSLAVNEGIMLVCQKRLVTWREAGPALIPIFSQAVVLRGCKPGIRK